VVEGKFYEIDFRAGGDNLENYVHKWYGPVVSEDFDVL